MLGDAAQGREDFLLGAAVERAGGLVEQQDRRVLDQRAGDRHALFLTARKLEAALADFGVETLRQAVDQVGNRRALDRGLDLHHPRAIAAISDVIADGVVEQHAILRHDTDRAA